MPPQLLALTDGPNIPLDKPIVLLGRHQECDIQLASRKVSRRHCCIAQVNDYLVVRDLGSTNGIRINGIRVLEGSLNEGDELTIGNHRFQVEWNGQQGKQRGEPVVGREASVMMRSPEEDDRLERCEEPVPLAEPPRTNLAKDQAPLAVPRNMELLPPGEPP